MRGEEKSRNYLIIQILIMLALNLTNLSVTKNMINKFDATCEVINAKI